MPTVTQTRAVLVRYPGWKLAEPSRLLFAKLIECTYASALCDLRGHLHGEVGPVLAGKHQVSDLVEDLRELGRVVLADRKDDGLSDLAADRVTERVSRGRFCREKLVGGLRVKALFRSKRCL